MPSLLEALEEKYGLRNDLTTEESLVSIFVPKIPPRLRFVNYFLILFFLSHFQNQFIIHSMYMKNKQIVIFFFVHHRAKTIRLPWTVLCENVKIFYMCVKNIYVSKLFLFLMIITFGCAMKRLVHENFNSCCVEIILIYYF